MTMTWTPADDDSLVNLYQGNSASQIAAIMGRTRQSIKGRIAKLALKKTSGYANNGQFNAGMTPWNKGVPFDSGGRSHQTRFKEGHIPHTMKPIGHERITADGYRERKMTATRITRQDYVGIHILMWREHFGDIPPGNVVVFRDGNKQNIVIENLECITRPELMRRNSVHGNYPPEWARLVQLRGAITRKINNLTRSKDTPT